MKSELLFTQTLKHIKRTCVRSKLINVECRTLDVDVKRETKSSEKFEIVAEAVNHLLTVAEILKKISSSTYDVVKI